MQYTVDGKHAKEHQAFQAWCERSGEGAAQTVAVWNMAHEQSTDGYIARDGVEESGVTMRHPNEEQS